MTDAAQRFDNAEELNLRRTPNPHVSFGAGGRHFCLGAHLARLETTAQCIKSEGLGAQAKVGGAEGIRTPDPHNAIVVLYQLSYDPIQSGENFRMPR